MLGVHGNELPGPGGPQHQLSAGHQGLLVRQGEHRTGVQGRERRREAHGTDEGIEHGVRRHGTYEIPGGVRPADHRRPEGTRHLGRGHGVGDGHLSRVEAQLPGLRDDLRRVGTPRGDADDLEDVRVGGDYLDGLGADGAGTSQN